MPVSVLIVDDHPALRAGLSHLLAREPGFVCLGAVSGEAELTDAVVRARPDVVILDYALGRSDGLSVCFRIKQRPDAPGVILYSGYADDVFAVPAALAQADAVVPKSAPVDVLLDALRDVASGRRWPPRLDPDRIQAASARLSDRDLPVLGMLFARLSVQDIGETLGMTADEVVGRALQIIRDMQALDRVHG